MKRLLIAIAAAFACVGVVAADTGVRGHYRSNGTYVAPHYRTAPNSTRLDNHSTKGNVNPHTGKVGTADPYKPTLTMPRSNNAGGR